MRSRLLSPELSPAATQAQVSSKPEVWARHFFSFHVIFASFLFQDNLTRNLIVFSLDVWTVTGEGDQERDVRSLSRNTQKNVSLNLLDTVPYPAVCF